jgi:hypothetical protein
MLDVDLASELCPTVGDKLFLLVISFYMLVKYKICQLKFGKWLEML